MNVGALPDLTATKLDVIRFRAKLRDYLDLAAIDQSGLCSLEAGLGYYVRRFGYRYPPSALEQIVNLLDNPGTLPLDPELESHRDDALNHLNSRVPDLRDRISQMRDAVAHSTTQASAQQTRPRLPPLA
jgi:hypothetical protein